MPCFSTTNPKKKELQRTCAQAHLEACKREKYEHKTGDCLTTTVGSVVHA